MVVLLGRLRQEAVPLLTAIRVEPVVLAGRQAYGQLCLAQVAVPVGIPMAVALTAALATILGPAVQASVAAAAVAAVVSVDLAAVVAAVTTTVVAAAAAAIPAAAAVPILPMVVVAVLTASALRKSIPQAPRPAMGKSSLLGAGALVARPPRVIRWL